MYLGFEGEEKLRLSNHKSIFEATGCTKQKFEAAEDFLVDQTKKKEKVATQAEEIKHFKKNKQDAKTSSNQTSSSASGSSSAAKKPRTGAAGATPAHHTHDAVDLRLARTLLPPLPGCGLYKAKDGRWKVQMPNCAPAGAKTRSFSSSFSQRKDADSFVFLIGQAWSHYNAFGGVEPAPIFD